MKTKRLRAMHHPVSVSRTPEGVPRVTAQSWEDAYYALGWLHGRDRGGQIALMRITGEGRLCEQVRDTADLLEVDVYFRRLGFARDARRYIERLSPNSRAAIEVYCRGVNTAWAERKPWALRLAGYVPEPLEPHHVLLVMKLMAFVGLAESQRMIELFVVEALQRGASETQMRELFPTLNHLDVPLLRGLRTMPPLFPTARKPPGVAQAAGSNNWVVSGAHTASGSPILCNDPHLEVNRLPAVMYEAHVQVGEEWVHGATVPGLLGFVAGRNRHLAWGVTYSCADTSDFFLERCRQGRYLRGDDWRPFHTCTEHVLRKRHPTTKVVIYENDHGLLEGNPTHTGDYLCWAWCGGGPGGVESIGAFLELMHCRSVMQAQKAVRAAEIPTLHMVFADSEGNIGYQFVGCVPRRREGWSGLAPVPGWEAENDWRGTLDPAGEAPSLLNPEQGFIVTANEARQNPEGPVLATAPLPRYRHDRIEALLAARTGLTLADMQAIQYDLLSPQAERLRPVFLPYLPPGPQRELLEAWNARYTSDSRAATLLENLYHAAILEVFGAVLGRGWVEYLLSETPIPVLLYGFLDDVLCTEDSHWLPAEHRDEVLRSAVRAALARPTEPWGARNRIVFQNIFFGGRLPRFLRLDLGPHPLKGSRATTHQGSKHGRGRGYTTFAPAYHFVTDLTDAVSWTNLPGGPSESRFCRWYASDLKRWLKGRYKPL